MGSEYVSIEVGFTPQEYERFTSAVAGADPIDVLHRLALKVIGDFELRAFARRQQDELKQEADRLNKELGLG